MEGALGEFCLGSNNVDVVDDRSSPAWSHVWMCRHPGAADLEHEYSHLVLDAPFNTDRQPVQLLK